MADRYLLYIDVLGFSDLASSEVDRVADLYEAIASLNVHRHPNFKAIVFSDTILVYNTDVQSAREDPSYYVMYLCEFAQDLQARLIARNIFFRAVLVRGDFTHYELNSVPCFYGDALIHAYRSEKKIKAIGLFMHWSIVPQSDIFATTRFNDEFSFVFITQSLDRVRESYGGSVPLPRELIEDTDEIYGLAMDIMYLRQIHNNIAASSNPRVRAKFKRTWRVFSRRYPRIAGVVAAAEFSWESISPGAKWASIVSRYPEAYSFAVESRVVC